MPAVREPLMTNGSFERDESIAIIGLSCRFPEDATDPEHFWRMLCAGKSAYSESNRYNVNSFHSGVEGKLNMSRPRGAHFLREDIAAFDANFFTINEAEATAMDPQARIMMEVSYEAFENAGLPIEQIAGSQTSCYVGVFTSDYREMLFRDPDTAPQYSVIGAGQELISNRLSWFYDLKGESFTLNTACSSSLVALHQGCQSLRAGDADMSIVGGCNLLLNPDMFVLLSNMQFLARDGRCKSFDAKGDGYGRGEGFAVIILKRVEDAIRDGDSIRAVIRGTGVNQDGHTKGITVPSPDAQASLIRSVYERAGLEFNKTQYVEAHGTGTKTGDPIELEGISKTIGSSRQAGQSLLVGSVKPNIGHLESAAGLAGLIKAIYILERGLIPPNILFENPNPRIPFEEWKISVPTEVTPWPTDGLRRVSVQGFGYGGTNAHAILDDGPNYLAERRLHDTYVSAKYSPPKKQSDIVNGEYRYDSPSLKPSVNGVHIRSEITPKTWLFVLSAHDMNGLKRQRKALLTYLQNKQLRAYEAENQLLHDLAFTLSEKRSRLTWRSYISASSLEELMLRLEAKDSDTPSFRSSKRPRLGFVFTGQGAQWARMGLELEIYPVFRQSVEKSDIFLRSALHCSWSSFEELRRVDDESQINKPAFAQPLCTVLQIALVDLLESWKIVPSAMIGHSSGEIAAAYCLGALTREDALKAAYYRGLLADRMRESAPSKKGAMLAVGASESEAQQWINELDSTSGDIVVACVNSPSSVTLSGDVFLIDELQSLLKEKGIFVRKLKVDTAYHSPHMNAVSMQYLESLNSIQPGPTRESRRMYSAVTGLAIDPDELGAVNWVRNLVSPVLFYDALCQMLEPPHASEKVDVLLELGPHSTLQGAINQTTKKHNVRDITYVSMLSRGRSAIETSMAAVATLFAQGVSVNLKEVNMRADGAECEPPAPLVDLPPYAWNHSHTFWGEPRISRDYRLRDNPRSSLLGAPYPRMAGSEYLWKGPIRIAEQPWIRDHMIQTSILYPAAGFIAMAIEAAAQIAAKDQRIKSFKLRDIQIVTPAVMKENSELECVLQIRPHRTGNRANSNWLQFSISSCHSGEELRENCFGLMQTQYHPSEDSCMFYEDKWESCEAKKTYQHCKQICNIAEDAGTFYAELASVGLNYGATFQNMTKVHRARGTSCFTVAMLDPELSLTSECLDRRHIIHPTNLDAMFHGVFAAFKAYKGHLKDAMVPVSIKEVEIAADIPHASGSQSAGFCKASEHGFRELMADLVMFDDDITSPTVTVKGFHCSGIASASTSSQDAIAQTRRNIFSRMVWKPAVDLLTFQQVGELIGAPMEHTELASKLEKLQELDASAIRCIVGALAEVPYDAVHNVQLLNFYSWMEEQQKVIEPNGHSQPKPNDDVPETDTDLVAKDSNEVGDGFVESEMLSNISKNMVPVLRGLVDPAELLIADRSPINTLFSDLLGLSECFEKLARYINLLAFQNPDISILEFGSASRGAAPSIFSHNNDSLAFARYVFACPSDFELRNAEECLASLQDRLEFKIFAADKDPGSQGFSDQTFDVVICSSLEPLPERVMCNLRQLLKPRGKACFAGLTKPRLGTSLILRCLEARQSDTFRAPTEIDAMEALLPQHGFSPDLLVRDFESTQHQQVGIIVGTPMTKTIQNGIQHPEIVILEAPEPSEGACILASQLASMLESISFTSLRLKWGDDDQLLKGRQCICLAELDKALLEEIGKDDFQRAKEVVTSSTKLLWVALQRDPANHLVVGMARSIRNEMPGKSFVTACVQNDSLKAPEKLAERLVQLVVDTSNADSEFLEEDGLWKICRVIEDEYLDQEVSRLLAEEKDRIECIPFEQAVGPQKLAVQSQGMLDSICLETDDAPSNDLGEEEVEIEVKASGLNFRDVMVAMGQIPDSLFGFDASGVIARVGKSVRQFAPGDRVCTLGHGAHRTNFRNKANFCQIIPEGLTFEEAATLPLVHCTAYHALVNVARIAPKQTILIHAAAGGVGQAAIQLAKHFDVEIFATVGSAEKREIIKEVHGVPDDHIFNSRDLSFAKGILRMTKGRGVDCVLNSLSGQALQETWNCIASFGTFVEIGIRDILDNTGLEMRPFIQDATFSFLNLKHIMTEKPKLLKEILEGTFDFLRQGVTKPVSPVTTYAFSGVEDAFRLMQTGKHLGKIAIAWNRSDVVPVLHRPKTSLILNPDKTYMLCGGFGGLGQSLAHLLVHLGARNLCFISRSGKKSLEAQKLVEKLEHQNVRVCVFSCDISVKDDIAAALERCLLTMPPIGGVIQGAMVLRDISFASMTHAQWIESLRPKVQGTWNLHLLLPQNLDFFITLSSFAGVFGNRTQSNYAAAGAFQDALAHHRVTHSLKAVTVDLGIMRDIGVIAERGVTGSLKEWEEPFGIRERELHLLMTTIITKELDTTTSSISSLSSSPPFINVSSGCLAAPSPGTIPIPPQILTGFATGGTAQLAGINPPFYFSDPRFSHLALSGLSSTLGSSALPNSPSHITDPSSLLKNLASLSLTDATLAAERLTIAIVARVAKSLQTEMSEIGSGKPLHTYGVDSLVAIEFANWIFREVGVQVTVFEVLEATPIVGFAEKVVEKCREAARGGGKGEGEGAG